MDKYEYNLKLDQMKNLCAEENYDAAAEIADTINWNRIKNVNALVRAGEIYEKVERYEDSKEILLMAYDRSPIGRMIIYRLAEIAIKMGNYTEAQEYYDEFVEIAPHDPLKYVLRYSIKKAQGADYKELVPILEELKEQEYTEEWAYELAYLYHKAGMSDACIDACDELILWFGDGPYVERALELKMLYQPLTKQQEDKYRRFRQRHKGVVEVDATEMEKAGEYAHETVEIPQVTVNPERFNTVNLQEEIARGMQQILEATEKETVSDTMDNIKKMVEEIPYLQLSKEDEEKETAHIETDEEIDGSLKINFQEMIGEDSDGQMSLVVPERMMLERQITGQMSIAEVLDEWERTRHAAEVALQEAEQRKLESAKARALQEAGDIMDRLTDVIPKLDAGISPKELLEQEYLQNEPSVLETAIEEISEKLEDELEHIPEETEEEGINNTDRIENLEEASKQTEELEDDFEEEPESDFEEEPETAEAEEELVEETESDFEAEPESTEAEEELVEETESDFEEEPESTEAEEELEEETESDFEEEPESAESEKAVDEVEEKTAAQRVSQELLKQQEQEAGKIFADMNDMLGKEIERLSNENAFYDEQLAKAEAAKLKKEQEEQEIAEKIIEQVGEIELPEEPKEETKEEIKEDPQATKRMPDLSEVQRQKLLRAETMKIPEIKLPEETEDKTVITSLSDELKKVFSYFVPVKGMEEQLCQAITGVSQHLENDETANKGNLIIQGGKGCGKTVLATSMIKALQKVTGRPNGRIGKIDADALNKKDIQALLRKVAGGCLIIENAGNISRQTAVTLSLLLEHDASGILIILEDTSKGIKKALLADDGFAKKFSEKVNVPIFTNDELVSFARSYARELGYEIEELAVLALYNRISNIQKLDQATTLTEVKEIVDEAIEREEKKGLKKAFSILTSHRYTQDDRVILRERDFED